MRLFSHEKSFRVSRNDSLYGLLSCIGFIKWSIQLKYLISNDIAMHQNQAIQMILIVSKLVEEALQFQAASAISHTVWILIGTEKKYQTNTFYSNQHLVSVYNWATNFGRRNFAWCRRLCSRTFWTNALWPLTSSFDGCCILRWITLLRRILNRGERIV